MRSSPATFDRALRVQWVCAAFHHFLGRRELRGAPALLSGYRSIVDHPALTSFSLPAFNLRQMGISIVSDATLREAISDWATWEAENRLSPDYVEPPFAITLDDRLSFSLRVRENDPAYVSMINALSVPLPDRTWQKSTADVDRPFKIPGEFLGGNESLVADTSALAGKLASAPRLDLTPRNRSPIKITLAELERIADELDAIDASAPERIPGNFKARLRDDVGNPLFSVLSPSKEALASTDTIEISKVKHLIGLPGSGKSTLILLIVVALSRSGLHIVLLLPSIEASLNYVAELERYGVNPALLVGQSPDARRRHSRKLAERIAASDDTGGMGRTAPGSELLSVNCALAGFLSNPEPSLGFPHLSPPCSDIQQRRQKRDGSETEAEGDRLCPLSAVCGRQKSARELANPSRNVWIGHVISTDVRMSPHFASEQIRFFETIARISDLVIVDEADGAQAALDGHALAELDLTGSVDSYEATLLKDLMVPVASGQNQSANSLVQNYTYASQEFSKLNRALVTHLLDDRRGTAHLNRFQDTFVTGNTVLAALYLADGNRSTEIYNVIRGLWDGSVRRVMAERSGQVSIRDDDERPEIVELDGIDINTVAVAAGLSQAEVEEAIRETLSAMTRWFGATNVLIREEAGQRVREGFFKIFPPDVTVPDEAAREYFSFLLEVTALVFQFLTLIPMQQAMIAEGVHSRRIFGSGVSVDMARFMPEALVGRLSGIKIYFQDGRKGRTLKLKYVSFASVPRLLLYHLTKLLEPEGIAGPAVLLASATSFLEESPSYHIPVGPHFVLKRENEADAWRRSEYLFAPVPDPADPRRNIRLSGAFEDRERGMRAIVDHYLGGDDPLISRMRHDFDAGRRTALVVNSYEQVRLIKDHARRNHGSVGRRIVGVVDQIEDIPFSEAGEWVTASQVERLGARDDWDAVVFPMRAIGRGVNIVYPDGPRKRDAAIGTVVFFMRPHPSVDSLDFTAGLAGRHALDFDRRSLPASAQLTELVASWRENRSQSLDLMRRLLRYPIQAGRLGDLIVPFTADIMVDVLQTIGRAMRNGCKTRAIFVDEAWAPSSVRGRPDTPNTSMLVCMRDILRGRLEDPDRIARETYSLLYRPFLDPLTRCKGIIFPDELAI
ncbi:MULTISPECIES: hypothetical protein [Bradyrhizobium]|jgi:hypothetical protein|uniref:hypothetical protein n=1 Tax=Bradyrhizobium sp. TaxID=376 RepID=UPI004037F4D4